MKFAPIHTFETALSHEIYASYCQSFPEDERRELAQFQKLFNHKMVELLSIVQENKNIGYLILWKLSHFVFIEHFEVFETFRGQSFGSQILKELSDIYPKIVLETEHGNLNEIAKRRVSFYQRNGFSIIDNNYIQPKYSEEKKSLPLLLLANFTTPNPQKIATEIHNNVYGINP